MERGGSFEELRRLTASFEKLDGRAARKSCQRLLGVALPLLLRELAGELKGRADLARRMIAELAGADRASQDRASQELTELRARAVRGLQALALASSDTVKARALGLLADLGLTAAGATFSDPEAVQRRSAMAIAEQLGSEADVAAAADLMTRQLAPAEMISLLELMTEITPEPAARLIHELAGRVDLEGNVRSDVRRLAAASWLEEPSPSGHPDIRPRTARSGRPAAARPAAIVQLLTDGKGGHVVIAVRRRGALRRWRRFAVLIAADGALEDCLYEDDVPASELGDPMNAPLYCGLIAEGYQPLPDDALPHGEQAEPGEERDARARTAHGRELAAAAAQRAASLPHRLTSPYYLGRDILDLGDAHLGPRPARPALGEIANAIGRAVDLLAAGDVARARDLALLCARSAPDNPDVAATLGQCFLALGELTPAAEWLGRAAAAEPGWPMHHWNLAVVHHSGGAADACADALATYLRAVEEKRLLGDREQEERIALARRYLAAHRPSDEPKTPARRARRLLHNPAAVRED